MDPRKIAYVTEALNDFNLDELHFLMTFISARLSRQSVMVHTDLFPVTTSAADAEEPEFKPFQVVSSTPADDGKVVKWSDVAATPKASKSPKATKKVPKKKSAAATPPEKQEPSRLARETLQVEPRDEPATGSELTDFCGTKDCGCWYRFRDGCTQTSQSGKPILEDEDPDDSEWSAEDRFMDPVRFDPGLIYANQLYIRGWEKTDNWKSVRDSIKQCLIKASIPKCEIYVDSKGFAFVLLPNHALAVQAQAVLSQHVDLSVEVLVNFATRRPEKPKNADGE